MPNAKFIAWIVGLSLLTTIGLEHYRSRSGGGVSPVRKIA
jgi:hypothetical protein